MMRSVLVYQIVMPTLMASDSRIDEMVKQRGMYRDDEERQYDGGGGDEDMNCVDQTRGDRSTSARRQRRSIDATNDSISIP